MQNLAEEIKELRKLARDYRDIRNRLVEQSWEISRELTRVTDEDKRASLLTRKADIAQQIKDGGYMEKLQETLEQIREKEIALKGNSDVGGPKPYIL